MNNILLVTINAKWIHPSLALRLLKANLGPLEKSCGIIEFALRQPLREKVEPILIARPRILGLSVSIWNHTAALELLKELHKAWEIDTNQRPIIVLGGPEVSYLPSGAEIFSYADYCVLGEGEIAFRSLCEDILNNEKGRAHNASIVFVNHEFKEVNVSAIKNAYHLYTDEDLHKKLIYVEASRGCPFGCEFCLSAMDGTRARTGNQIREFPLEPFFAEMDTLINRIANTGLTTGRKTFKFLDRTFNLNINRAQQIMEFFLKKIKGTPFVVHFEMVPSRFPPELIAAIACFPPETLRLEIGIQTLNPDVSARIGRPSKPEQELAAIRLLREKTNAIIHADLIAGLPGEDMDSFGKGFDALWAALSPLSAGNNPPAEIQLGILKLLPGAPIIRHTDAFGMRYNTSPPYEVMETAAMSAADLNRIKNVARFWELIVNRGLIKMDAFSSPHTGIFNRFMTLADSLLDRFGRNWGIDKNDLQKYLGDLLG